MTFSPDAVAAKRHATDWKGAIRRAGELYERDGIATSQYTEAMIAAVEEFGPYMVLIPGVAMPHAATADGVKRDGCVLVTLSEPVEFGSKANDPVDIIISFAAGDRKTHMERIKQLAATLSDGPLMDAIRAAQSDADLAALFNPNSTPEPEGTPK